MKRYFVASRFSPMSVTTALYKLNTYATESKIVEMVTTSYLVQESAYQSQMH